MKTRNKIGVVAVLTVVAAASWAKNYMSMKPLIVAEADIVSTAEAVEVADSQDQTIRILLGTEDTAGQYTMFTDTFSKAGGNVPPHIHHWHDEAFYVTRGRFKVQNGEMGESIVEANTVVFTPRGSLHTWEALEDDSHFVVFYTPGGWEHFYDAVRKLTPEQREDEVFMKEFMESYDENFQ